MVSKDQNRLPARRRQKHGEHLDVSMARVVTDNPFRYTASILAHGGLSFMNQSGMQNKLGRTGSRLAGLTGEFKRALGMVTNPRVPMYLKLLLPVGALAYWFWPVDLLPGLPIDDVAVLLIALRIFLSLADKALGGGSAQDESVQNADDPTVAFDNGTTVDGTWQTVDN